MAISISALETVSNFFRINNTAVNIFVNGISVFYIIYLQWIAACGEVEVEGMFMAFHMWSFSYLISQNALPVYMQYVRKASSQNTTSRVSLFSFLHCYENLNRKMVLYHFICTSLITGEQKLQKEGLARLIGHSCLDHYTGSLLALQTLMKVNAQTSTLKNF